MLNKLKYTPGAKPGVKVKRASESEAEQKLKRQLYENEKRPERTFDTKWKVGRPWLVYEEETGTMKCSVCVEYGPKPCQNVNSFKNLKQKNHFITGSKNFKSSTVYDHEKSKMHQVATGKKEAKDKPRETPGYKGFLALNEHARKQLEYKFRNVHALVAKNRPMSDYVWLNQLDRAKGLDVGETYDNAKAGAIMLGSIAHTERQKLLNFINMVNFFSLTMDGSTDDGVVEQETLFIRSCHKGKVTAWFLCIGEPQSTASEDLYGFVIDQLKYNQIFPQMSKCVGFGSDGASNMVGKKSGLVTLLKKDFPAILGVHCLAHRLELALRDTVSKNDNYQKLITLLLGLYYHYKNSAKQRKALKDTFQVQLCFTTAFCLVIN